MTEMVRTMHRSDRFDEGLDALATSLRDQILVSQDRCIDGLLDLFNDAPDELAKTLLVDIMDDIRHVRTVRSDWLLAELDVLAAAVSVEEAFQP